MSANLITPKELQKFIVKNPTLTNEEIAKKFAITKRIVWANRGAMKSALTRENNTQANVSADKKAYMKAYYLRNKEVKEKINVSTFPHQKSVNKDIKYRDLVIKAIDKSTLRSGSIIGLPAENFKTEQRIYNEVSTNFQFFGVEKEDKVYYELLKNLGLSKFKMVVYPTELENILNGATENSIAHLIADYCGQLHTYQNELTNAVRNNIIMIDGIIAITINKRITGAENHKFYDEMISLNETEVFNDNCKVEKAFNVFLQRLCGFNYRLETCIDYWSEKENGGKGANMMLAIIRRVK